MEQSLQNTNDIKSMMPDLFKASIILYVVSIISSVLYRTLSNNYEKDIIEMISNQLILFLALSFLFIFINIQIILVYFIFSKIFPVTNINKYFLKSSIIGIPVLACLYFMFPLINIKDSTWQYHVYLFFTFTGMIGGSCILAWISLFFLKIKIRSFFSWIFKVRDAPYFLFVLDINWWLMVGNWYTVIYVFKSHNCN